MCWNCLPLSFHLFPECSPLLVGAYICNRCLFIFVRHFQPRLHGGATICYLFPGNLGLYPVFHLFHYDACALFNSCKNVDVSVLVSSWPSWSSSLQSWYAFGEMCLKDAFCLQKTYLFHPPCVGDAQRQAWCVESGVFCSSGLPPLRVLLPPDVHVHTSGVSPGAHAQSCKVTLPSSSLLAISSCFPIPVLLLWPVTHSAPHSCNCAQVLRQAGGHRRRQCRGMLPCPLEPTLSLQENKCPFLRQPVALGSTAAAPPPLWDCWGPERERREEGKSRTSRLHDPLWVWAGTWRRPQAKSRECPEAFRLPAWLRITTVLSSGGRNPECGRATHSL